MSLLVVMPLLHVMTYVVFINHFGIKLVLCNSYLTRFDLTKDLLLHAFFIAVFHTECRCDQ